VSKQDFWGNLRQKGGEVFNSVKSAGENAVKAGIKRSNAEKKSASPRSMAELIQRAVIILLVLVCFISVIFASCAKAEPAPPADGTAVTDSAETPSVSPAL